MAKKSEVKKSVWDRISRDEVKKLESISSDFIRFMNKVKTEREVVLTVEEMLKSRGFVNLEEADKGSEKVFYIHHGKSIVAVVKSGSLSSGINLIASHIDSPRLDLKPNPLYESEHLALMKTQYYGGIKKYQWLAVPLVLRGVVVLKDGTVKRVSIGDKRKDPVFVIPDLLPHLGRDYEDKKLRDAVEGEKLQILVGSIPMKGEESDRVKKGVLKVLKQKYGIAEDDFVSADLEVVPAFPTTEVGFDRSLIGGYAQDDRVCAYTSLRAFIDTQEFSRTAVLLLVDREEIGSYGITGIRSKFFVNFLKRVAKIWGEDVDIDLVFERSLAVSADVTAGLNPLFQEVHDAGNAARIGFGVAVEKYTGGRGKGGASEASAELMAHIRRVFDDSSVVWQTGVLGKVDAGGGGTVALYLADLGIPVVDIGVPLLSMHSPFEVSSKSDVYEAYLAYKAIFEKSKFPAEI